MYGIERYPVRNTSLPHQVRALVVPKNSTPDFLVELNMLVDN